MTARADQMSAAGAEAPCPVCGAAVFRSLPAQIAPFVRARCQFAPEVEARSWLCDACDHVFLTPLLNEVEVSRLYADYRSGAYDAERLSFEPDYAGVAQAFADPDSDYHRARRTFYDEFHAERFGTRGLIVDFSDGGGYFARYAFPLGDVVTLPKVGTTPGLRLPQVLAAADVLMTTHSLQGVPDPLGVLASLVEPLRSGAGVWIEVPVQYFGALRGAFQTEEARFARGVREFGPLLTLHENLAHFSVRSLRRLLARVGLHPQEVVRSSIGVLGAWCAVGAEPSGG